MTSAARVPHAAIMLVWCMNRLLCIECVCHVNPCACEHCEHLCTVFGECVCAHADPCAGELSGSIDPCLGHCIVFLVCLVKVKVML